MKMMFALYASLLAGSVIANESKVGDFQVTIRVMDDFGKPVSKATVGVSYLYAKTPWVAPTVHNTEKKQIDVLTDSDGTAIIKGANLLEKHLYYGMNLLNGYYYTDGGEYNFEKVEDGKCQPWNPTFELVAKPIINPVPMYAKQIDFWRCKLPTNGIPIGYDLLTGDWVAPYGKGLTNDFIFELHRQFTNVSQPFDATLTVALTNRADGIQPVLAKETTGLSLRLPRTAPDGGYESKLVLRQYRETEKPIVNSDRKDQNYFFRIRTKKDDMGNTVSALYGKINGNIKYDIFNSPTALISFTYYLNPTPNDRNMEFNTKSNLFKNLSSLEQVTAP